MDIDSSENHILHIKSIQTLTRAFGVCFSPMAGWLRLLCKKKRTVQKDNKFIIIDVKFR